MVEDVSGDFGGLVDRLSRVDADGGETAFDFGSRYALIRTLSEGGMGRVYLATEAGTGRRVAIKTLREQDPSEAAVRRFRVEGEVLSRLRHEAIADVIEIGLSDEGGRPFIVMEYLAGARSIDEYARDAALGPGERVALLAPVLRALGEVHRNGVIHRDVKPANILVASNGRAKLIDFGIARVAATAGFGVSQRMTQTGELLGTIGYMSPEQLAEDAAEVDTRTDVYSVGVVLFELLTSEPAFASGGCPLALTLDAIRAGRLRDSAALASIPATLKAIIQKAMETDRNARYATADAFADDLECWLRGESVSIEPPSRIRRMTAFINRHPVAATAVACIAMVVTAVPIALLLTVIAMAWYNNEPHGVVVSPDRDQAWLVARSGRPLHDGWNEVRRSNSGIAQGARVDDGFDDDRVLIVLADEATDDSVRATLFDFDNLDIPVWSSDFEMSLESIPAYVERDACPERAELSSVLIADVFAEYPGDEIVCAERNAQSLACRLRVYGREIAGDPPNEVLFEAWHPGWMHHVRWDAARRELIVAGFNNRPVRAEAFGLNQVRSTVPVVFGVRPRVGLLADDWLTRSGQEYVRWYNYLPSNCVSCDAKPVFLGPSRRGDGWYRFAVLVEPVDGSDRKGRVTWRVEPGGGSEVEIVDDRYWALGLADPRGAGSTEPWLLRTAELPWYEEVDPGGD